jgi:BirA family transcriptional regulator, biotin operon repressor / biotin---[acetyl-CoA-carboxylase] ligase
MSKPKIGEVAYQWSQNSNLKAWYESETTSTNDNAKELALSSEWKDQAIGLFLTDFQTSGRGRGKNVWITDADGDALLSSWMFALQNPPQPVLSPLVGLALIKAAHSTWPFLQWNLKAPNDLYVGDKKIAGILIETVQAGAQIRLIIGLGFNVLSAPEELPDSTSLTSVMPAGVPLLGEDWVNFLDRFLLELSLVVTENPKQLSPSQCHSLTWALNRFSGKREKVISVSMDGSLEYSDRTIHWQNL